jgi:dihydroneopterin aldolase
LNAPLIAGRKLQSHFGISSHPSPHPIRDTIEIRHLRFSTHIGVSDDERAAALQIQALAAAKPRALIETLAVEIADMLLTHHPLQSAAVSIEKHILPDTECVAVHVVRER